MIFLCRLETKTIIVTHMEHMTADLDRIYVWRWINHQYFYRSFIPNKPLHVCRKFLKMQFPSHRKSRSRVQMKPTGSQLLEPAWAKLFVIWTKHNWYCRNKENDRVPVLNISMQNQYWNLSMGNKTGKTNMNLEEKNLPKVPHMEHQFYWCVLACGNLIQILTIKETEWHAHFLIN